MEKPQDADSVGDALGTANAHEGAVEAGLEQGFFGSKVGQAKPLLQAMNPQHHRKIKRRAARLGHGGVWRDRREQFAPRHNLLHFIEQDLLARATAAEIKAKVFLFHAVVDGNLRASVKQLRAEF